MVSYFRKRSKLEGHWFLINDREKEKKMVVKCNTILIFYNHYIYYIFKVRIMALLYI